MKLAADVLYHGSKVSGLTMILPTPARVIGWRTGIFASPDRSVAISHIPRWTDKDFKHGRNGENPMHMIEAYAGAIDILLKGCKGTLYTLPGRSFQMDDRLTPFEAVSFERVRPLASMEIVDVLAELEMCGWSLIRYTNDPLSNSHGAPDSVLA